MSLRSLQAAFAQSTGEAFLPLITVSHSLIEATTQFPGGTMRFALNSEDVVSRSNTYAAWPGDVVVTSSVEGRPGEGKLILSAIDGTVIQAIDQLVSPPTVDIEIVMSGDDETVVFSNIGLRGIGMRTNLAQLEIILIGPTFQDKQVPILRFTPENVPGAFTTEV